jgi:hypothetical protein
MRERTRLADQVGRVRKLEQERADALEYAEMAAAEGDEASLDDVSHQLALLKDLAARAELEALLSGEADANDCFMEINAGAGGTESNDWANMLLRMYTRWAQAHGMTVEFVEETVGEQAGIKSATIRILGPNAYGWLKTEAGIHRLVRISPYDSSARRHTSFASVWVYPVVDDKIEIEINPSDVRVDTYRSSGAGGQHVNKTDSAVRTGLENAPRPPLRGRAAAPRGRRRRGRGRQGRHRLGPPDPLLRPAALPDGQGPAHQRRNQRHRRRPRRRPRPLHGRLPGAAGGGDAGGVATVNFAI